MACYRLYRIDSATRHFCGCDSFEASSDELAIAWAAELQASAAAELWSGKRLVKMFEPAVAA